MNSIDTFFLCFNSIDKNSPPEIGSIEITDFTVDITILNVSLSAAGLTSLRTYFGDTPVSSQQLDGRHGVKVSISRLKIPDQVYSVFSILKYIQAQQDRGLFMGLNDFGPMFLSFNDLTHAQLYGASGFGKSSFFRFLLAQTLAFHQDVMNYIIDPKQIDYRAFKDHPRVGHIATNRDEWYSLLGSLLIEMGVREHIYSEAFSTPPTSLQEYREFKAEHSRQDLPDFPRILLWIDEAHMTNDYQSDELQNHLALLLKKGRAFGIHVMATTQRIADMPTAIKTQASTVMLFYIHDSMGLAGLSLDDYYKTMSAIRGRLSFYNAIQSKFVSCQTPFLTSNEALAVAYGFGSSNTYANSGLYRLQVIDKLLQDCRLPILLCRGNNIKSIAALRPPEIEENLRMRSPYKFLNSHFYEVINTLPSTSTKTPAADTSDTEDQLLIDLRKILGEQAPSSSSTSSPSAQSTPAHSSPQKESAQTQQPINFEKLLLSQNTPNPEKLVEDFQSHYKNSHIDFSWCTRDLTGNQGLLQIYKRHKGETTLLDRPVLYESLALDELTQARLDKYCTEVRENANNQRKSPFLVISGLAGMGKNTVSSAVAGYLQFPIRKSKADDLLGFDSVKAEIQYLFSEKKSAFPLTNQETISFSPEFILFHDLTAALTFYRNCRPHQIPVLINEWKTGPEAMYNKTARDFMELKDPHLSIELAPTTYKPDVVLEKLISALLTKYGFEDDIRKITLKPFAASGIPLTPLYLDALIERAQKKAVLSTRAFDWILLSEVLDAYRLKDDQEKTGVTVVVPRKTLTDMVAHEDTISDILDVIHKAKTLDTPRLQFAQRLRRGERMVALFSGPPGTGKSMAAEIIAKETQKELWVCDFGKMQNAYVGETEKILSEIFYRAQTCKAVLLLDEADAFLAHRNSSQPSYMTKWINHLLNLIENYNGILILTTNHPENMDPAFSRRIDVKARFYNPDIPQMKELLRLMLMPDAPLAGDLDFDQALQGISLSGGLLRNALERLIVKMERFNFSEVTTDLLQSVLNETQLENMHMIQEEKRIGLV